MRSSLKKIIPAFISDKINLIIEKNELRKWENQGKYLPVPHRVKQLAIEYYQKKYNISVLIESGTYLGDMVKAQLKNFKKIYSIELGKDLWKKAVKKFEKDKHVFILQGDSGEVLIELATRINEKAIFWLDGHYSAGITAKGEKECPIYEELNAIFKTKIHHILLIDDARCFEGKNDYPTIAELSQFVLSNYPNSDIEIKDDIIRIIIS